MASNLNLIIFLILLCLIFKINSEELSSKNKNCFRASVYEHILIDKKSNEPPSKILNSNLEIFEKVVKRAAFIDSKIVVFPEHSLQPVLEGNDLINGGAVPLLPKINENLCTIYKEKYKNITLGDYTEFIKSEKMRLLDQEIMNFKNADKTFFINTGILRKLSCLAQDNHIYIAINIVTLEIKSINDDEDDKTLNLENNLKSTKWNSELDALKLRVRIKINDQLINEKLTNQLNKINNNLKTDNSLNNSNYRYYNTELVFDNEGKLIAKYKKYNLYDENEISRPKLELVTFDTQMGRFGIATGEDIQFEEPIKSLVEIKKIDHLIHSSSWSNELPALFGGGLFSSIATKYKINVLSANRREFKNAIMSSGIYNGKTGVRVQSSFDNHNRLLIADLPTGSLNNNNDDSEINSNEKVDVETVEYSSLDVLDNEKVDINEFTNNGKCSHFEPVRIAEETYEQYSYVFKENTFLNDYRNMDTPMNEFKSKRLENTEGKISDVCDNSVCCEIEWRMNDKFNFVSDNYYLIANSRLKQSKNKLTAIYEQICALVSYNSYKSEYKIVASTHFDKLAIRGKFNTTEVFPYLLSSALYQIPKHKWQFKQIYNETELSFNNIRRPILLASLYGRVYEKDIILRN